MAEAPDEQLHRLANLPCLPERDYRRAKPETTHAITCTGYRSKGGRRVSTSATAPNRISRWGTRPTLPTAKRNTNIAPGTLAFRRRLSHTIVLSSPPAPPHLPLYRSSTPSISPFR